MIIWNMEDQFEHIDFGVMCCKCCEWLKNCARSMIIMISGSRSWDDKIHLVSFPKWTEINSTGGDVSLVGSARKTARWERRRSRCHLIFQWNEFPQHDSVTWVKPWILYRDIYFFFVHLQYLYLYICVWIHPEWDTPNESTVNVKKPIFLVNL